MRARILCVDDEQYVLDALMRTLRLEFDVTFALGGEVALKTLREEGPFAVIVSDLRMPGMDGTEFLTRAAEIAPETVRVLLTGNGDLVAAVEAVNRCDLFRFLLKPTTHDDLFRTLRDAAKQYELVVSEREWREQTLRGAVSALLEALSLSNPVVYGRATRIRHVVTTLLPAVAPWDDGTVDIAASLSQLGAVSLPTEIVAKLDHGAPLDRDQQATVDALPAFTAARLESIPRLDKVRRAIRLQCKNYDGTGPPEDECVEGDDLPLASRLLRVAADFDQLEALGVSRKEAVEVMTRRRGAYDPEIIHALQVLVLLDERGVQNTPRPTAPWQLCEGMVLARDITDRNGVLLVGRGHVVTPALVARILNISDRIEGAIWVTGGARHEGAPVLPMRRKPLPMA